MEKQVVIIGGGDTFDSYDDYMAFLSGYEIDDLDYFKKRGWKGSLQASLGDDFEIIAPSMPNTWYARYSEWKIWFEKIMPLFETEVILIGHSLGGLFLAKYLSENNFQKKIRGTFLVAAPYDEEDPNHSLADFSMPKDLSRFSKQSPKIYLYQSKDDPVVQFDAVEKYANMLPEAHKVIFEDREHFNQEEFPELVKNIRDLY
jgi:uncharacterized protein